MSQKNLEQKNINTILKLLKNEIEGDINSALEKMTGDYSMTWVYKRKDGVLFPTTTAKDIRAMKDKMKEAYSVKGREYKVRNIIAHGNVVMAEFVESYPDPKDTSVIYRTPMVIVWDFKDGKVRSGRHYCDPQLSFEKLTQEQVEEIYK